MPRDPSLYRPGVGIVLTNGRGGVWLGRRAGRDGWQLPQGGIDPGETPTERMPDLDPEWVDAPTIEGRRLLYDGAVLRKLRLEHLLRNGK